MAMKNYTSKPGKPEPFTLDGVKFETSGSVSLLDLVGVAALADVDVTNPKGLLALGEFFESALGNLATYAVRVQLDDGTWEATGERVKLDSGEPSTQERLASGELVVWEHGQYDRFRKHCRRYSTDPETLLDIMQDLISSVSLGPTTRPSVLSDGPPSTGLTSTVISASGEVTSEPLTAERDAELRAAVASASGS